MSDSQQTSFEEGHAELAATFQKVRLQIAAGNLASVHETLADLIELWRQQCTEQSAAMRRLDYPHLVAHERQHHLITECLSRCSSLLENSWRREHLSEAGFLLEGCYHMLRHHIVCADTPLALAQQRHSESSHRPVQASAPRGSATRSVDNTTACISTPPGARRS